MSLVEACVMGGAAGHQPADVALDSCVLQGRPVDLDTVEAMQHMLVKGEITSGAETLVRVHEPVSVLAALREWKNRFR